MEHKFIPGLYYEEAQSHDMVEHMQRVATWYKLPETQAQLQPVSDSAKGRKVVHYGYQYIYTPRHRISQKPKVTPIPDVLIPLKEHAEQYVKTVFADLRTVGSEDSSCSASDPSCDISFEQCIVNRYLPGEGISSHIDNVNEFGPVIACYTFLAGREMEFHDCDKSQNKCVLYTKPNTMYIMCGDVRYKWTHQMRGRKNDVVHGLKIPRAECFSVTFRQINRSKVDR